DLERTGLVYQSKLLSGGGQVRICGVVRRHYYRISKHGVSAPAHGCQPESWRIGMEHGYRWIHRPPEPRELCPLDGICGVCSHLSRAWGQQRKAAALDLWTGHGIRRQESRTFALRPDAVHLFERPRGLRDRIRGSTASALDVSGRRKQLRRDKRLDV